MTYRLGVDVGGTFTDFALYNMQNNQIEFAKTPSTPNNQAIAVIHGIKQLTKKFAVLPSEITNIIHGTTVATNALLERKTASPALITTAGFRDVLQIGRQDRPQLYDWRVQRPKPLVPRHMRFEVRERILPTGEILFPLCSEDIVTVIKQLKESRAQSVAVCLLHSYINPVHEQAIGKILARELPYLTIVLSSEILPEFKEYERMSTTTINAYVAPVIGRYLHDLENKIAEVGIPAELYIMQSNGGIMSSTTAIEKPYHTILSGPAGGVIGSVALAKQVNEPNVISIDMGGTSFDISLTYHGDIRYTYEGEVEGLPIRSPMIDIHTLGAGGGSIAWIDTGGALRVGPHSAGADPGPACYGKGGDRPTVTDANLVLGRLNPDYFLGGEIHLDIEIAREVIQRYIAEPLGLSLEQASSGIIRIVNINMVKGIRVVSVERGFDPREFCLIAFGGAGPMHAAELSSELNIPRVLIPIAPGINSALGLLMADLRHDYVYTKLQPLSQLTEKELNEAFITLENEAITQIERGSSSIEQVFILRTVDLRYKGQGYELEVPISSSVEELGTQNLIQRFNKLHQSRYGFTHEDRDVELVNLRLSAICYVPHPQLTKESPNGTLDPYYARKGQRKVYFKDSFHDTKIYERAQLRSGDVINGPAVIEQLDSTTVVWPGQKAQVDVYHNLIVHSAVALI